jgi:GMP synthase-like glutamine amidotransferase
MRVHVLQHVPFEGLGSILPWLRSRNATITTTRFFESPSLPQLADFDVLIALGGPMSVNDEDEFPWLREEKRFISESIRSEKPVLGICLGAQLMASSLGARVYRGARKEIGWFRVRASEQAFELFAFPPAAEVFHWHGETFDLPDGAMHLASSEACRNQAFRIGARAIGLQFHLETTPESADALIAHCRAELVPDEYVQSEQQLRSAGADKYALIHRLMDNVLTHITRDVVV